MNAAVVVGEMILAGLGQPQRPHQDRRRLCARHRFGRAVAVRAVAAAPGDPRLVQRIDARLVNAAVVVGEMILVGLGQPQRPHQDRRQLSPRHRIEGRSPVVQRPVDHRVVLGPRHGQLSQRQ